MVTLQLGVITTVGELADSVKDCMMLNVS